MADVEGKAPGPRTDHYGICLGEPHPTLSEVRKVAADFGIDLKGVDEERWWFVGMGRVVDYFPKDREVRLKPEWSSCREGDYAVAIALALTGRNPLDYQADRLCETIRNHIPKS
jgi:hypothetical protein